MSKHDRNQDREELIARSIAFLGEVKDMTAGTDVERWLNQTHGPGSEVYEQLDRKSVV